MAVRVQSTFSADETGESQEVSHDNDYDDEAMPGSTSERIELEPRTGMGRGLNHG